MNEQTVSVTRFPVLARLVDRVPLFIILSLLLFLIFARTGENIHGQMTALGETLWEDYYALRGDAPTATCDVNMDIEQRLAELEAEFGSGFGSGGDDFDLFEDEFDKDSARISLTTQKRLCIEEHKLAERITSQTTTGVILFRTVEHYISLASLVATSQQQLLLLILLFCSAGVATHKRHHIAFRPMVSLLDYRVSTTLQAIANTSFAIAAFLFRDTTYSAGIEVTHPQIINGLVIGSTYLASLSVYQLFNIPKTATPGGHLPRALLSLPLYSFVMLIFVVILFVFRGHPSGLAIYFSSFFENAGMYLDVALYLWSGMLLKQTQLGERVFSVFTPWRLPPELLAFVAILVMAAPTAYTGASSIIILAMGAVVYRELRKVDTRRQLALAATAMSGSSGIVLKPCLLVVIISMLNKEVVTDDLFHWGVRVFMLTISVFFVYAMITRKDPLHVAPIQEALKPSLLNFQKLLPYTVIFFLVILLYAVTLNAYMDQFSAPIMLPLLIIAAIIFERVYSKEEPIYQDPERMATVGGALTRSMSDASVHIGGLLMLMSTFMIMIGFGGKAVSIDLISGFDTIWGTMAALMVMFVLIGMFMESMAAVALVSLAIAPLAYAQGVNPIHFWMTCLVALELGYLSPPVALSHIFTRQVVGEEEAVAASLEGGDSFYYRHERLLLPLMVMGTTLLIVGFGPLIVGYD